MLEECQVISSDWQFLYVNNAALKQNNLKIDDLLGKKVMEIYPGIEKSELFFKFEKCMNERIPVSFENKFRFPDGHIAWFEVKIEPIPEGIFILSTDITERKRMEEELQQAHDNLELKVQERTNELEKAYESLKESEEKFRLIFDKAEDSIVLNEIMENGLPGKIIEANEATSKRLGYTKEELLNMKPQEIVTPEKLVAMQKIAEIIKKEGHAIYETIDISKEGQKTPVEVNTHVFKFKGKKTALIIARDITNRKEMEKQLRKTISELRKSEKKYRTLYKNAPVGIFHSTSKGKFINVNPELARIFGYDSPDELILAANKNSMNEIYVDLNSRTQIVKQAIETNDWVRTKMQYLYKNSEIIILDVAFRNVGKIDEDNYLLEGFASDITARKKAKEQLKETIKELERSNMELEQFAYVSSHDLQEPLRTIASFTQLLQMRYKGKLDKDADEFMDFIVEAAVRMKEQIDGLLEYSRVTRGEEFELADMDKILNQTIQNLKTSIEESNAQITYDKLPNVICDAGQLERVFQNLISNAIRFRKYEEPLKIHVSAYKSEDKNEYIFSVSDNGIGIEEQYMKRIFTIFQRLHTRKVYKGTGIGLSIVKRIIERHGGNIWVESLFKIGSTFYFTIPLSLIENKMKIKYKK